MKVAKVKTGAVATIFLALTLVISSPLHAEVGDGKTDIYDLIDGPSHDKRDLISIRVANLSLNNPDQEFSKVVGYGCVWVICGDITDPVPVRFDDSPASVVSLEYEHLNRSGWYSLGLELFQMERSYTAAALVETRGKWEMTNLLVNAKLYMNSDGEFQPYLGAGFGAAQSKLSGAISGNADGFVWKTELGLNYRLENISFRAGYQRSEIGLMTSGARGNDGQDREIHVNSFVNFDGYFVGLGIQF